jgi:hypothetical protein
MPEIFESLNPEQTEFSSGISIIIRVDTIHKQLHLARVNKDYEAWYEWLVSFFMELVRFMKFEDSKDTDAVTKGKHNNSFEYYEKLWKQVIEDYVTIRNLDYQKKAVPRKYFNSFHNFEIALTILEQKVGLGMTKRDARFAMAGGR